MATCKKLIAKAAVVPALPKANPAPVVKFTHGNIVKLKGTMSPVRFLVLSEGARTALIADGFGKGDFACAVLNGDIAGFVYLKNSADFEFINEPLTLQPTQPNAY